MTGILVEPGGGFYPHLRSTHTKTRKSTKQPRTKKRIERSLEYQGLLSHSLCHFSCIDRSLCRCSSRRASSSCTSARSLTSGLTRSQTPRLQKVFGEQSALLEHLRLSNQGVSGVVDLALPPAYRWCCCERRCCIICPAGCHRRRFFSFIARRTWRSCRSR